MHSLLRMSPKSKGHPHGIHHYTCEEYKNALSRKNKYSWKNLKHPFKGFSGLKKRIEQSEMPFDIKYEATGIISWGYSCMK